MAENTVTYITKLNPFKGQGGFSAVYRRQRLPSSPATGSGKVNIFTTYSMAIAITVTINRRYRDHSGIV